MGEFDQKLPTLSISLDSDHKATEFRLLSSAPPHMRAFHLAWVSLFSCFFGAFAPPPLLPVIRDNLSLTDTDIANAGIASVSGTIFARLAAGPACDLIGPRLTSAVFSLLTTPAIVSASLVSSPTGFILLRFFIGFSLGNFVCNQYWMSSMFSRRVVGLANGFAAGWANMGSGAAQFLMPLVYSLTCRLGLASFTAWRVAFFVPGSLQTLTSFLVLAYGQDVPGGNLDYTPNSSTKPKDGFFQILCHGIKNYRGWILGLTYGYCYGIELTVDNIIAEYFYDRFNVSIQVAGVIAASFGLANLVSRPAGGMLSDEMGRRFGMRGRLWGLWTVQSVAGLLCILLGQVNSLAGSVLVMFGFSLFVQAASGLTFGVVPFISRRALGVISGMTGSGGAVGAVITQLLFFSGSKYSKETGITLMGSMIIACTLPIMLIYSPQWGGMLCGPDPDPNASDDQYYYLFE